MSLKVFLLLGAVSVLSPPLAPSVSVVESSLSEAEASAGKQEQPSAEETEKRLEKYHAMMKWVEKHGGYGRHISFQYRPESEVGLIADEDIKIT